MNGCRLDLVVKFLEVHNNQKGWKILIFFNKDWFDFGKLRHIEWSKQLGRYKIKS